MKAILKKTNYLVLMSALVMGSFLCACEDKETEETTTVSNFSVLGVIDDAYYLAQTEMLSEGSLTFVGNGTQLAADQAARIVASGGYIYSLNYGTGLLTQLKANATGGYDILKEINVGLSVGTNKPRFKLADANTLMVYNVVVTQTKNTEGVVTDNKSTLRLTSVAIPDLTISNLTEFVIPQTANAALGATIGYDAMRVDGPVISGDKIYFGLMHLDMFNAATPPPSRKPKQTGLETLVFDYPSFKNGAITESAQASGHTGGYRAPSMHVDEKGDVYQSNWFMTGNSFDLSAGDKTVIKRLKNGVYDESYLFNVSDVLGLTSNVATVGWFYVGDGIGYMPVQLEADGHYYNDNSWSVARVDIYNQTAVLLNVPKSNLFDYESAVVADGKFYMAISPIGGEAYVYEFDPKSTSADGFKQGLKLSDSNVAVEGIY